MQKRKHKTEESQRGDVEKMKETGFKDPPQNSKDKVIEQPDLKCVFKECPSSKNVFCFEPNYRGYYKVTSFLPLFSIQPGSLRPICVKATTKSLIYTVFILYTIYRFSVSFSVSLSITNLVGTI